MLLANDRIRESDSGSLRATPVVICLFDPIFPTHSPSKSGEACYYVNCIFKFASSLGQFDTFSLAEYRE
jgi:hypothetical protein